MLVTVATYPRALEAQLAQARLMAEGIEALVADEQVSSILPLHTTALGGVRLQVPEEDEVAALEVLELAAEDIGDDDPEDDVLSCGRCGSPYVEFGRTLQENVFGGMTLGVLLFVRPKQWHCQRCSYAWQGPPPALPAPGKLATAAASRTPYREAGRRSLDRQTRTCFRFPQTRAGVGTFFGFAFGLLGYNLFPAEALGWGLLLAATGLGWLTGRVVLTYACSACRRALAPDAQRCPGCRGEVRGLIATMDDHFRALADVEVAADRRAKKRKKKRAAKLAAGA